MLTVFLFVSWAYVCIKMGMSLPSIGQNTGVRKQTDSTGASVSSPALMQNTAEPYIFIRKTTHDSLTYRQGIVRNGKRNTMEELPWNVPINVRKRTIN